MKFKIDGANKMVSQIGKLKTGLNEAVRMSLGTVGLAILEDTITQDPKPPIETGYLRGAQFMYIQGIKKSVPGSDMAGPDGLTNNAPPTAETKVGEFKLEVGLNTPYAKYQHENLGVKIFPRTMTKRGTPKSTQGISGKFLELKLLRNASEYAQIFADEFTKRWGK